MFYSGDLVWAKMKGFPAWPARVSPPRKGPKKSHTFVYFFGTKDYAWIPDENVSRHSEAMLETVAHRKMTATLKAAVQEITEEAAKSCRVEERGAVELGSTQDVEPRSIQEKLALKYKRRQLKEGKFRPYKKRFFGKAPSGHRKRPRAVIGPYDEADPCVEDAVQKQVVVHVKPTQKTIGFLGLGAIGHSIAHNLLKSGHKVSVWNRTPDRCEPLVKCGALRGASPADVVAACDITFSCMGDPEASKAVVFSQVGVLRGLERCKGQEKGYVEMTSLDDQTSQEIWDAVRFEGGRYLEAQLGCSTREQAEGGELEVVGAGDVSLFRDCETVFHAVSRHAYFVSPEVGVGANLSLVTSSLVGAVSGALGEALALADRMGVGKRDLLDIARLVGFGCPLLDEKSAASDGHKRAPPTVSVKNQQKDLHLTMQLSDAKSQPMPVVAAANELYKHAKRLGYRNRDYSAIYLATKF